MKALVVYTSMFGNTEKVAREIGEVLKASVKAAGEVKAGELKGIDLLVLGSPVHGGMASQEMQKFIKSIPAQGLEGIRVGVFDTRFDVRKQNLPLKLLMKTIGYAADKMGKSVKEKGGRLAAEAKGFFVEGKEGPLSKGELDQAQEWAKGLPAGAKQGV